MDPDGVPQLAKVKMKSMAYSREPIWKTHRNYLYNMKDTVLKLLLDLLRLSFIFVSLKSPPGPQR